jgi:ClpP class serine protease
VIAYPRIYQAVHFQPWLIEPSAHAAISEVLHSRLFGDQPQFGTETAAALVAQQEKAPAVAAGETWLENSGRFAPASIDADGIATVRASGVIAKQASAFEKSCFGGVGPQDIEKALGACMDEDTCRAIVLQLTSPGGTVAGVPECADLVAQIQQAGKKELWVFAEDLCCSAAYWIAAGASRIYTTALANVGSVGVYLPWVDQSARAAMAGLRVTLIKDGTFKGAGYPGTSLSRADEDRLQADVNAIGTAFRAHISAHRTAIQRADLEGQSFLGTDAAEKGFADGIAANLAAVKGKLLAALR